MLKHFDKVTYLNINYNLNFMSQPRFFDPRIDSKEYKGHTGPFWTGYEELEKIMPGISDLEVRLDTPVRMLDGHVTRDELAIIASVAKYLNPKRIFEFGTFDGLTTLNLAMNVQPETEIITIDLPEGDTKTLYPLDGFNQKYLPNKRKLKFEGTPYSKQIRQIKGDSAFLNTDEFTNSVDMIFVDGAHSYEYCKNDTEKAMKMLSENGVIVWHDYGGYREWPGVTEYLNYLAREKKLMLYWLFKKNSDLQTWLVMYCNPFKR